MKRSRWFKKKKVPKDVPEQEVAYALDYLMRIADSGGTVTFPLDDGGSKTCSIDVRHDVSGKQWKMTVPLEPDKWWMLSVFIYETGAFHMFSLDYEDADDSHYAFQDERKLRAAIYQPGDEKRYLHEVMTRCIRENGGGQSGGFALLDHVPVTASFHYY